MQASETLPYSIGKSSAKQAEINKPLLLKLALNLGLDKKEAVVVVDEASIQYKKMSCEQRTDSEQKMLLCKILFQKVVYCISSELCLQIKTVPQRDQQNQWIPSYLFRMPFGIRAVYLLHCIIDLKETEMAGILNLSTIQLRERLAKAKKYLSS